MFERMTPAEVNKKYHNYCKMYGITPKELKKALNKAADYYEKHPDRWTTGFYNVPGSKGRPKHCSVGQTAEMLGKGAVQVHTLMACVCLRWSWTLSKNDIRYTDASFGRVSTLNDVVLADPDKAAKMLRELAECA